MLMWQMKSKQLNFHFIPVVESLLQLTEIVWNTTTTPKNGALTCQTKTNYNLNQNYIFPLPALYISFVSGKSNLHLWVSTLGLLVVVSH